MANTELLNVIRIVRAAEKAVSDAEEEEGLLAPTVKALEDLYDLLSEIEERLVVIDLSKDINKLEGKAGALSDLVKKVKKKIASLETVAKMVNDAASAVNALVEGFGILVKAGIA